jgi:hypothetical protein
MAAGWAELEEDALRDLTDDQQRQMMQTVFYGGANTLLIHLMHILKTEDVQGMISTQRMIRALDVVALEIGHYVRTRERDLT